MNSSSSYKFHLPFSIQSQYGISGLTSPVPIPMPNLHASLGTESHGYAITVTGFPSSDSAFQFLPQAWLGLTAVMLETKAAFSASTLVRPGRPLTVSNPSLLPNFQGPSVLVDEGEPNVVPEDVPLLTVGVGSSTVSVGLSTDTIIAALARGMTDPRASLLFGDARFRTAVDLFAGAAFESSKPARLLTFAMALEVLTPPVDKHSVVQALIDGWLAELTQAKASYPEGSPEADALEALEREVLVRRHASIRWRIRQFVTDALSTIGDPEAANLAKRAVQAYDARSRLVHDGSLLDAGADVAITDLRTVLERLFSVRLA
jgi:hypothetical protein